MQLRQIKNLDECYRIGASPLFITGLQALVRLLLTQRHLDKQRGLNTAGFVSGYRGSPLGGLDRELWRAAPFLKPAHIEFQPGLNEDLAATSIWGSQQASLFPGARYDGVFALWYGKGPGVDRSGDAFKHGNAAGTAKHGGVLVAAGDDHTCKSSSLPQQSEYSFIDAMMPVLNPSDVQELIELGLMGFAMSRFSGCWVGMKVIQETADATQTVRLDPDRFALVEPGFEMPPEGLNIRWPDPPLRQEYRLQRYKLSAALAFARANRVNRLVIDSPRPRFGIVTTGKAHLDVLQALEDLGIDAARASEIGIRLLKVGMNWPLDPRGARSFAEGLEQVLVVEEKRAVVESQIKEQLYNWPAKLRPLIIGKFDEHGEWILPSAGELTPATVARVLARRLRPFYSSADIEERVRFLEDKEEALEHMGGKEQRLPHFCSGCPHNTSTRVPEGSRAIAGIGCHFMAGWMDRSTVTFTQMGGEGATWIGQAPFTETKHVFQNLGDGTYAHSGILAIRAAVAAGVNITYKILFNEAVAMTGGQPVEGHPTVARIARQLVAEGVHPVVIVTDEPRKHAERSELPAGVSVHHRRELDRLQRRLRETRGVSALIYDQTCAAELRRLRKRRLVETPAKRVVINDLVCEGCGDCNLQSNCLSVVALETEFGRKRAINQSSCNLDFSCVQGFCPSFVSVHGAKLDRPKPLALNAPPRLPEPPAAELGPVYNILIAGVGGTGVVTTSGLLGLAAHLEGKAVLELDQTGLAQKFGAVISHVRISGDRKRMHGMRIPAGQVDLLVGVDLMVAASREPLAMLHPDRSAVVANTHEEMPPSFIHDRDYVFPADSLLGALQAGTRRGGLFTLDATRLATALLGDGIAANMFMLGFAFQQGLLPIGGLALYRALELYGVNVEENKRAFDWGRYASQDPVAVGQLARSPQPRAKPSETLEEVIARRREFLVDYQDEAYGRRYVTRVERIRAAEEAVRPGSTELSSAVARNYFKLLAYKDEYEVARLHTQTGFLDSVRRQFGSNVKLKFHFSPPLLARTDPNNGRPRQYEVGGWVLPLLRLLARLRVLRGTPLDVFSYSKERRSERQLLADYERLVDRLVSELDAERLDLAVGLAGLPDRIRGFGPVKEAAMRQARSAENDLLHLWSQRQHSAADERAPATAA
jgi:indolepyruvate ferredoxin oxidoreductase